MADSGKIAFLLGHEQRSVGSLDPNITLLNYLRRIEGRTGTKEGCAEGDCGACTVVLGEAKGGGEGMDYRAVNACIQLWPLVDGKQVLTVEDMKGFDGRLHPVQGAMVDRQASQCGFCTPGFVMSLFALRHGRAAPERQAINDALAGNLCRCTGYGPIVEAAEDCLKDEAEDTIAAREAEALEALQGMRREDGLDYHAAGKRFFAPQSLKELTELLTEYPDACLVAGLTDVGLWVTKQRRILTTVISLTELAELKRMTEVEGWLEIGAGVTYSDAMGEIARLWPDFGELIRRLGSVQIRNVGTIGGNIANGSPIGDSLPPLIALDARLVLRSHAGQREIALADYFIDYGKQDRRPGEFLEKIRVPLPRRDDRFACYKITKRFDQDISALCAAFRLRLSDGKVAEVRLAYGGMAGIPKRAAAAEDALLGQPWSEGGVRSAMMVLAQDFTPLSDQRASAEYRLRVAENLLFKFFLESAGAAGPIRVLADLEAAGG